MLAARWGHRSSKDIDIKVNSQTGYPLVSRAREEPMIEAKLRRQMTAAGSTGHLWLSPVQLVFTFGDPADKDPARIDLTEFAPKIHMAVIRTTSEGMAFWSSTNEEILAGKWKDRRLKLLVRDVFDFGVSGIVDGLALQGALSMDASAGALDKMVQELAEQRGRLQEQAQGDIVEVPEHLRKVHEDPARAAAQAIGRWATTEVRVEGHGDGWDVKAACEATPEGCAQGRFVDLASAVRRAGALGGLSSEERLQLYDEASNQGGASHRGGRSAMTECCAEEMTVQQDGTVEIRDFGEATVHAPTIEAAVNLTIRRGTRQEKNRREAVEELRRQQAKPTAHGSLPAQAARTTGSSTGEDPEAPHVVRRHETQRGHTDPAVRADAYLHPAARAATAAEGAEMPEQAKGKVAAATSRIVQAAASLGQPDGADPTAPSRAAHNAIGKAEKSKQRGLAQQPTQDQGRKDEI